MRTNLDLMQLEEVASSAKEIRGWIGRHCDPERYDQVKNLERVREFVHMLDLLETVLTHFEISAHLSKLALEQFGNPTRVGSLGWQFWQIDVEEFFASELREYCYQLYEAWKKLDNFAGKEEGFKILKAKSKKPGAILLARHNVTHPDPAGFESQPIARRYSILRRPYRIRDGKFQKKLAKETMPKVADLIQGTVREGVNYLRVFREATIG